MRIVKQLLFFYLCSLLNFSICFVSPANSAQLTAINLLAPVQFHAEEPNTVLATKYSHQKPVAIGSVAQFKNQQVMIDQKTTVTLGALTAKAFAPQVEFGKTLKVPGVVGGAILVEPLIQDEVTEFDDAFVVRRATTINVIDPKVLERISIEYRKFMGKRSTQPILLDKLSPESVAGLERFMKEELPRRPVKDPMRLAAVNGPQAILDAIRDGKGMLTVEDTIMVPKVVMPLSSEGVAMYPPFNQSGTLILTQPVQMQKFKVRSMQLAAPPAELSPAPLEKKQLQMVERNIPFEVSGSHKFSEEFLAGFTKGHSWQWEQRWSYTSGFFRVTVGAGYGFGLRVPFTVSGSFSPTNIMINDRADRTIDVRGQLQVKVFDAEQDYYRRVGLPESWGFGGDEFVTEMQLGFGYKFRALWKDIAYKKVVGSGVNYSQSFLPPFGHCDNNCDIRFPIPTELTGTEFDVAALEGEVQVGLHLSGNAQVGMDFNRLIDGHSIGKGRFIFKNATAKKTTFRLDRIDTEEDVEKAQARYGFMLDNLNYRLGLTVTPEVRVEINADYKDFARTFFTDWLPLNFYTIRLGAINVGSHEGTPSSYIYADGLKSFTRNIGSK